MAKKKKGTKFKKVIYPFLSADKGHEERWYAGRDPMDWPKPIRAVFAGSPSCGKTRAVLNIILRSNFDAVYVLHEDKNTREYDPCGAKILTELPPNSFWINGGKDEDESESSSDSDSDEEKEKLPICLVIDDICYAERFNKVQAARLNRVCGFISSHFNVSLLLCAQDFTEVPAIARRCSQYFAIWRPTCLDNLNTIGRRVGLNSVQMRDLFETHVKDFEDVIVFDKSVRTPYPIRKNFFQIIKHNAI